MWYPNLFKVTVCAARMDEKASERTGMSARYLSLSHSRFSVATVRRAVVLAKASCLSPSEDSSRKRMRKAFSSSDQSSLPFSTFGASAASCCAPLSNVIPLASTNAGVGASLATFAKGDPASAAAPGAGSTARVGATVSPSAILT